MMEKQKQQCCSRGQLVYAAAVYSGRLGLVDTYCLSRTFFVYWPPPEEP